MKHIVKSEWQGDMHFKADAPGGEVLLDAAESVGGQGKGNRSKPLMLVSLAGCTGMDVSSLIKKMRIDVEDFNIEVSAELTEEHPKHYKSTHIIYNFFGNDLNEAKLEKAVNLSFDRYCGVIEMFKQFSEVTKEINFINK